MANKKIPIDKINALEVKNLLRKKYSIPEYEIFLKFLPQLEMETAQDTPMRLRSILFQAEDIK